MVFPKPLEEQTSKTAQSLELLERAFEVANSSRFPKNRRFTVQGYLVRDIRMK